MAKAKSEWFVDFDSPENEAMYTEDGDAFLHVSRISGTWNWRAKVKGKSVGQGKSHSFTAARLQARRAVSKFRKENP